MSNLATRSPASSSGDDVSQVDDEKPQLQPRDVRALLSLSQALSQSRKSLPSRLKTMWTSFRTIYDLSPKQVDDFMASYLIYNLDWADGVQMTQALGPDYRARVGECLQAYYGVLNHLCALGEVEKMYIPPLMNPAVSVLDNQLLYERTIAYHLNLQANDRILDLGCGRGRVAAHLAGLSGAQVTGLTIDTTQVEHAQKFNGLQGLRNEFVRADFNELPLPFEDASFDGFYEIQALSLCKNIPALLADVFRVLKPGARLSILDYVALPAYDASNPEHVALMRRTKPLLGAIGTPTPDSLERSLRDAGFVVVRSENASRGGHQADLIKKADVYFRAVRRIILVLVKAHLLPKHFKTLINRLCLDGDAFIRMDRMSLITTTWSVIAKKPKSRRQASAPAEPAAQLESTAPTEPEKEALSTVSPPLEASAELEPPTPSEPLAPTA